MGAPLRCVGAECAGAGAGADAARRARATALGRLGLSGAWWRQHQAGILCKLTEDTYGLSSLVTLPSSLLMFASLFWPAAWACEWSDLLSSSLCMTVYVDVLTH